jgi:hypothetical protein
MATFGRSDELQESEFRGVDLSRSRFVGCDLNEVVMRAVDINDTEIDAPWLIEGGASLVINGVDVVPLIDAELDRRFPGRELRRTDDAAGLQRAWAALGRHGPRRSHEPPPCPTARSTDRLRASGRSLRHCVTS